MAKVRVVKTTNDFRDVQHAREAGYYRLHFYCAGCDVELWHETYDSKRMFGKGSVLHSNNPPNFCPACGTKVDIEEA